MLYVASRIKREFTRTGSDTYYCELTTLARAAAPILSSSSHPGCQAHSIASLCWPTSPRLSVEISRFEVL